MIFDKLETIINFALKMIFNEELNYKSNLDLETPLKFQ